MAFHVFKRLTAALRTKTTDRNYDHSGSKWSFSSPDTGKLKRIMVFGDSNAFRPGRSKTSWPKLLEDQDPLHLKIFNESCDGRTTRYDIEEFNGLSVIGKKLTAHSPLNYVVVMLGTNDVKTKYGPPSVAEIVDGMRQILDVIDVHSGGAKSILLTPPPLGNVTSGNLAGAQSRILPVAAEYRSLAISRDIRLVDTHAILDSSTDLESDMIHLDAVGRQKVASAVWSNLQDLTPPPRVERFSGMRSGSNFLLAWTPVGSDTFYFRVRSNDKVIGRTMNTDFEVTSLAIDDKFTVEAVNFSQNTGAASRTVTYNRSDHSSP
jgi:lysophospholipase L1-like esterase